MDHTENLVLQFDKLQMTENQTIPLDILTDILIRLPAKPLLRFKSVCKSWYNLINNPIFIKLHLNRSLATNSNLHFVFTSPILHIGDFDTFENAVELEYPFKKLDIGGADIIGCCDGLLCIWNFDYFNFIVYLYNPTTRTYKILPVLPRPSHCARLHHHFTYGFGCDCVSDDYKFVRILRCSDRDSTFSYSEVMVYSLKLDSWMKVAEYEDGVPYCFSNRSGDGRGAFVEGSLHWILDTEAEDPPRPIVGFNLSTHSFFEVGLPEFDMEWYCYMHVGELEGCLCIMLNYLFDYEIWVMKEHGVVDSWTRLYRIKKARQVDAMEHPVAYTKNRKELLVRLCLSRVTSIDLETLVIEHVEAFGNPPSRRWDACVCVENLLMLDELSDFIGNEQQEEEEEEEENTTKRRRRRKRGRRKNRRN